MRIGERGKRDDDYSLFKRGGRSRPSVGGHISRSPFFQLVAAFDYISGS